MSKHEWKPGTVAVATVRGVTGVRVYRGLAGWAAPADPGRGLNVGVLHESDVTDVRPLVVLDPESDEHLAALCKALVYQMWHAGDEASAANGVHPATVAAALRSLNRPPKPAEPTGLGAVVEDSEGRQWIRYSPHDGCSWMRQTSRAPAYVDYESFHAVRILSEGVEVDR